MRKLIILSIIFLSAFTLWAERVDLSTAQRVAERAFSAISPANLRLRSTAVQLAYTAFPIRKGSSLRNTVSEADYYAFNIGDNNGFIIISGEDRTYPVLGYSTTGSFDITTIPDNMRTWMEMYQEEIAYAIKNDIKASSQIQTLWKEYLTTSLQISTKGVLLKTAEWSQRAPYNWMCPTVDGEEVPTGCVATATAIIMKYHEYPRRAIGGVSSYYNVPITYDDYDWSSMLMRYGHYGVQSPTDVQNNAVAKLMWHCGANLQMHYTSGGGSSSEYYVGPCLVDVFGYAKSACTLSKTYYTWNKWKQIIRTELDANRPVLYGGEDTKIGHAFVCDGYTKDGAFHINWGWGGSSNGYFLLSTMDHEGTGDGYAKRPHIVIGIQPPAGNDEQRNKLLLSNLECGEFPIRLGATFNVHVELLNLISFIYDDFNGYIGLGIVGTDGAIKSVIGEGKFDDRNPSISGIINNILETGERIVVLLKEDPANDWYIVNVSLGISPGFTMDGLISPEDDTLEEPKPYVLINDWRSNFDRENILIETVQSDARGFSIYNSTGKLYFRYKLKDPQSWLSAISMYYGKDYNTTFKPFEFDSSGEAWVSWEDFNLINSYLSLLSKISLFMLAISVVR